MFEFHLNKTFSSEIKELMCENKLIRIGNGWNSVDRCSYRWTIWKKGFFVCSVGEIHHDPSIMVILRVSIKFGDSRAIFAGELTRLFGRSIPNTTSRILNVTPTTVISLVKTSNVLHTDWR